MIDRFIQDKNGSPLSLADPHFNMDYTYDLTLPSIEDIASELQLTAIGSFEPLNFKFTSSQWEQDQQSIQDYWRPFQPKKQVLNDRESVLLYGYENDSPTTPTGLAQYRAILGRTPRDIELKYPTEAASKISCLQEVFSFFGTLGRTFLLRLNSGGFFPYHRDQIHLSRDSIRLIAFLGTDCVDHLEWEVEGVRKYFQPNTIYYVDTRKMHRLSAWGHKCDMCVINVPKTWVNVMKIISRLRDQ